MIGRRRFLCLTASAAVAVAGAGASWGAPGGAAPLRHDWRGTAMGADVALRVNGGDARAARAFFAESARLLRGVDRRFSLFRGSDLTRLNATGRLAHPGDDMLAVLRLADRVHRATGGRFDPTVQPLWQARRTGGDVDAARALVGWDGVRIGADAVTLARPGMALTLNGIAQGHAADLLADAARRHCLADLLIDTGEVRAVGPHGWRAAIAAPDGTAAGALTLRDRALATSAPFGTRIGPAGDGAHILSPDGAPPRWALMSVSAPRAAVADALSTAFCMLTRDAIDRALAAFPGTRIEAAQEI